MAWATQIKSTYFEVSCPLKTQNSSDALVKEESIHEINCPVIHSPQIFVFSVPWQKKTHVRSFFKGISLPMA